MSEQFDTSELFAAGRPVEVVGRFAERDGFKAAVDALIAAGFARDDLSVLDTHESLSASESPGEAWRESLAGLVGEINYVGPLTAAGLIAIATGPVGSAIAAALAAGISVAAVVELLDKLRATPHTESFARALEAGAILLWVRVGDAEAAKRAEDVLKDAGAADVHPHTRPQ